MESRREGKKLLEGQKLSVLLLFKLLTVVKTQGNLPKDTFWVKNENPHPLWSLGVKIGAQGSEWGPKERTGVWKGFKGVKRGVVGKQDVAVCVTGT
jgi:hypothetical protein